MKSPQGISATLSPKRPSSLGARKMGLKMKIKKNKRSLDFGIEKPMLFPSQLPYCFLNCEENGKTDYTNIGDSELIGIIKTQNPQAYQELFARYQKKLSTYIFHLVGNWEETEDILQNVFSKTFKNIENFDMERKFSSWIYRIAHNESINFLKRRSKRYSVSWEDIANSKDKLDTATNDEAPEERMFHQGIMRDVDFALEKLPPRYQQVLKLRYFEEYSYEAIGKVLNKPVNTVGTLINRAKRKLLEVVQKQGIDR